MADVSRLPGPIADVWDWQLQAACRGEDVAIFFHPENERGSARSRRDDRAKSVCQECPVLQQCARHALTVREPYGVWGGMTEEERSERISAAARMKTAELPVVREVTPRTLVPFTPLTFAV